MLVRNKVIQWSYCVLRSTEYAILIVIVSKTIWHQNNTKYYFSLMSSLSSSIFLSWRFPHGLCLFVVVVVNNLIVLSVILSSDEYRTEQCCFIVTQDTLLVTKNTGGTVLIFCGCKHCPNHAHHIVRYILQIFFSFY